MIFDSRFDVPYDDDLELESPSRQLPSRRAKSVRNYSYRRRERYSLRVPKTTYPSRDSSYPRSLESIDDWSLYRTHGSPQPNQSSSVSVEPRGARRVQSFRCTSKGGVVKMGDFFLGNASPDNYVTKEETHHPEVPPPGGSSGSSHLPRGSPTCSRKSSNSCESLRLSKTFYVYVAGHKSVGKHRVINACLGNSVNEKDKATILIDFEQFNINFKILEKIDDSEELADDSVPTPIPGKRNQALLIIYSITDRKSFEKAGQILTLAVLRHFHVNPKLSICLIANKSDLVRARVVTTEEGNELAARFNVHFIETSAEIGDNIEEIMVWIVEKIKENLSVVNATQGSKSLKTGSSKVKNKVLTRARTCIRQIFKRFIFKSRSAENLSVM